jgi:TRAP-type mannitol/chloroaromatic compound transport system permease small subunit
MERWLRRVDWINEIVGRTVGFLIVLVMVIVVYDVIARAVFGRPTQWVFELTKQLYAAHFMLLGGYALLHNAHIRVDLLRERLSERANHILELIGFLVFFTPFIAIMLWYGWRFAARSWAAGETTWGVVQMPVYPIKTAIVVAAVLLTIQAVLLVIRTVLALARRG